MGTSLLGTLSLNKPNSLNFFSLFLCTSFSPCVCISLPIYLRTHVPYFHSLPPCLFPSLPSCLCASLPSCLIAYSTLCLLAYVPCCPTLALTSSNVQSTSNLPSLKTVFNSPVASCSQVQSSCKIN